MAKGGRRSTTWDSPWKSGKTKVIRVPGVLAAEMVRIAHVLDEEGALPVTPANNSHVTGNIEINVKVLKEAAAEFLMTIPPRDRREAKRWLDRFVKSVEKGAARASTGGTPLGRERSASSKKKPPSSSLRS